MSTSKERRKAIHQIVERLVKKEGGLVMHDTLESALKKAGLEDSPDSRRLLWDAIASHPKLKGGGFLDTIFAGEKPELPEKAPAESKAQQQPKAVEAPTVHQPAAAQAPQPKVDVAALVAEHVAALATQLRSSVDAAFVELSERVGNASQTSEAELRSELEKLVSGLREEFGGIREQVMSRLETAEALLLESAGHQLSEAAVQAIVAEQMKAVDERIAQVAAMIARLPSPMTPVEVQEAIGKQLDAALSALPTPAPVVDISPEQLAALQAAIGEARSSLDEASASSQSLTRQLAEAGPVATQAKAAQNAATRAAASVEEAKSVVAGAESLKSEIAKASKQLGNDTAIIRRINSWSVLMFLGCAVMTLLNAYFIYRLVRGH